MLNRILKLALMLATFVSITEAEVITVTFSSQNSGGGLGTSSGSAVSTGSLVRLGYFDTSDSSIISMQGDISLLDEFFTVAAEVMVGFFGGETILNSDGSIKSYIPGNDDFLADGAFAHQVTFDPVPLKRDGDRLVMWAFNSDAIVTATEHGIFADSDWVTPSSLTLSADLSSVDPSQDLYVGTKGPEISQIVGGEFNKLIPVPEPSTAMLLLLGVSGVALRRQRRQQLGGY